MQRNDINTAATTAWRRWLILPESRRCIRSIKNTFSYASGGSSPYLSQDYITYSSSRPSLHQISAPTSVQTHSNHGHGQNFLTPRPAPLGPRKPLSRSRSPSPDIEHDGHVSGNKMMRLGSYKSAETAQIEDSSDESIQAHVKVSDKALGKRRVVEMFESDGKLAAILIQAICLMYSI